MNLPKTILKLAPLELVGVVLIAIGIIKSNMILLIIGIAAMVVAALLLTATLIGGQAKARQERDRTGYIPPTEQPRDPTA